MRTQQCVVLALALGAGFLTVQAQTATTQTAPPQQQSELEEFIARSKQPTSWLSWGADLRVRDEFFNNTFMMVNPDQYNQLRIRSRIWTTIAPVENLKLNARLTWETRYFSDPDEPVNAYTPAFPVRAWEFDELILDNLNIHATNLFETPTAITLGRQDLFLGNGWLFGDGTPRDGSRTYFFDAARVTYDWADSKTFFNFIYINQAAESDRWLVPINAQMHRNYLIEQDEQAGVLYVVNKSLKNTQIDGYFIYKNDDRVMAGGSDGNIYTFGARVATDITEKLKFRGEFAPQFGDKSMAAGLDHETLQAFGANTLLSYYFKDKLNNNVRVGYEYLSGDDPSTPEIERFDPLWGRWPQVSELLVYNFTTGPRPVEWGNYHRLNAGWSCDPMKKMKLSFDYNAYFAVQNELAGSEGDFRGHLFVGLLEYTFSKHLKGHLRAEFYAPGDYYDGSGLSKDLQSFLRGELYMTW